MAEQRPSNNVRHGALFYFFVLFVITLALTILHLWLTPDGFTIVSRAVADCWGIAKGSSFLAMAYCFAAAAITSWMDAEFFGGPPLRSVVTKFWKNIWKPAVLGPASLAMLLFLVHLFIISPGRIRMGMTVKHQDEMDKALTRYADNRYKLENRHQLELAKAKDGRPLMVETVDTKRLDETQKELAAAKERLRALDPKQRPLVSASLDIQVVIDSTEQANDHYRDGGGVAYFVRDTNAMIVAVANEHFKQSVATNEIQYRAEFKMIPDSPNLEKPVQELTNAQYLQFEIKYFGENQNVKRGYVDVLLNGNLRIRFDIPPQQSIGNKVFIRGIEGRLCDFLQ